VRVSRRTPARWTIPAAAAAAAAALGASLLAAPADAATTASTTTASRTATAVPTATTPSYVLAPVRITSTKLARKPPALYKPITLYPRAGVGEIKLRAGRDYRIVLPRTKAWANAEGLWITGGRNVVVRGGTVDVRGGVMKNGKLQKRAAYFRDTTGTVFVEGVKFMSSTTKRLTEGINVSLPGATLVLQNIRISSLLAGSQSTNHADAIQAWGGPQHLLVDGFVATTQYQGLFLTPNQHESAAVGTYDLRRVYIRGVNAAYLLWRVGSFPTRTSQVYISGSTRQNSGMWPNRSAWPYVKVGAPPVMYAKYAGYGYRTPGYL
jgi:hypothetical protein